QADGFIIAGEATVIRLEHIASLRSGDDALVLLPHLGEDCARAFLVEPVNLFRTAQKDSAQRERTDALWMSLRVTQRKSAAPRTAEAPPFFNAEMLAQPLDVRHQMPGRVFFKGSMRSTIARPPLIEQYNSIGF